MKLSLTHQRYVNYFSWLSDELLTLANLITIMEVEDKFSMNNVIMFNWDNKKKDYTKVLVRLNQITFVEYCQF